MTNYIHINMLGSGHISEYVCICIDASLIWTSSNGEKNSVTVLYPCDVIIPLAFASSYIICTYAS